MSADVAEALNRALAAEHAAAYAFPVVAARFAALRAEALNARQEHEKRRDRLIELLSLRGSRSIDPLAIYRIPGLDDRESGLSFARSLETACMGPYAALVSVTQGQERRIATTYLSRSAAAVVRWGGAVSPFPGLDA